MDYYAHMIDKPNWHTKNYIMHLGDLRRRRNLTQRELANLLGVQINTVSRWEQGQRCPSIKMLVQIAKILDVDIDDLIRGGGYLQCQHG